MEKCLSWKIMESSPAPQLLPTRSLLVFYSLNSRHEKVVSSKTQEDKHINSLCCSTRRYINRPDSSLSFNPNSYKVPSLAHFIPYTFLRSFSFFLPYSAKVFTTSCPDSCNYILNDHTDQARTKICLGSKYLRLMVSKSNSMGQLLIFLCSQDKVNPLNTIHQISFFNISVIANCNTPSHIMLSSISISHSHCLEHSPPPLPSPLYTAKLLLIFEVQFRCHFFLLLHQEHSP